jgi:hypothetical protein
LAASLAPSSLESVARCIGGRMRRRLQLPPHTDNTDVPPVSRYSTGVK